MSMDLPPVVCIWFTYLIIALQKTCNSKLGVEGGQKFELTGVSDSQYPGRDKRYRLILKMMVDDSMTEYAVTMNAIPYPGEVNLEIGAFLVEVDFRRGADLIQKFTYVPRNVTWPKYFVGRSGTLVVNDIAQFLAFGTTPV